METWISSILTPNMHFRPSYKIQNSANNIYNLAYMYITKNYSIFLVMNENANTLFLYILQQHTMNQCTTFVTQVKTFNDILNNIRKPCFQHIKTCFYISVGTQHLFIVAFHKRLFKFLLSWWICYFVAPQIK